MSFVLEQIVRGVVGPAAACALVLALGWRPWRRGAPSVRTAPLVAGLAAAAGYAVGHGLIVGWAFFLPAEKRDWLPWVSIGVAIPALVDGLWPLRVWLRCGLRVLLSGLAVWLVVRSKSGWSLAYMTMAVAGLWLAVEPLVRRKDGAGRGLAWLVTLLAASAVLAVSGSASFGQLVGVVAACLGVLTLAAWRDRNRVFLHGASGMMVVLPAALWLNLRQYSYGEVPLASALLLAAAMASPWLAEGGAARRLPRWQLASVRVFGALVLAALAVVVAWSASEPALEY